MRARGIFETLQPSISKSVTRRRSARYAARRRRHLHRSLGWACAVFLFLVSIAGFATSRGWLTKSKTTAPPQDPPTTADQRAAALRLLDEAVTARHEERLQGAANAITEARRLAPDLPGLDIFVGEVAWERRDAETVRRAAREAVGRGYNESAAKLLLALEKWMMRTGQDTATLGESVRQLLGEAEEASLSNAAPFFFHGEVSRFMADGEGAHRKLLGALHRQAPWASASLLEIKLQLAASEAMELGRPAVAPAPSDAASAFLHLRNAFLAGAETHELLADWISISPLIQTGVLLQDNTLSGVREVAKLRASKEFSRPMVPRGDAP